MTPLHVGVSDARAVFPEARVLRSRGVAAACRSDEDALTLAAQAVGQLMAANPGVMPEALLIATVSSPFAEGGIAQVLVEAARLDSSVHIEEHGGTVAASGGALVAACALARSELEPVLLVAADARNDDMGRSLGAGAVALLLGGHHGGVGTVAHAGSRSTIFRDRWRVDGSMGVRRAEQSLVRVAAADAGAGPWGDEADVLSAPTAQHIPRVGDAGCADLLVRILLSGGTLAPGESFTAVGYGGGVSHGFEITTGPKANEAARHVQQAIDGGIDDDGARDRETEGFEPFTSQARTWRDVRQDLRLEGVRDTSNDEVLFPPPPVATTGAFEPYSLAHTGTVVTFTRDHVFPQSPPTLMAVVSLDGGGRFYGQVSGPRPVDIGSKVRLVLRRLHDGGGVPHYFWKVMPASDTRVTREAEEA